MFRNLELPGLFRYFPELQNRLFKLGLTDTASGGGVIPDDIGPTYYTIANYLARRITIERDQDGKLQIVNPILREKLNRLMFYSNGQLKYPELTALVEHIDNTNKRSVRGVTHDITNGILSKIFFGDKSLLQDAFDTDQDCIRTAVVIRILSELYYPDTEVILIPISMGETGVIPILDWLTDKHLAMAFRDIDDQVKIYLYRHSVYTMEDAKELLMSVANNTKEPKRQKAIRRLIAKLEAATKALSPKH